MASIWPVYMGERWTLSRMSAWFRAWCGDVAGDLAEREVRVRSENGVGSASPGCSQSGPVDGAAVEAGRCAGLEAGAAQAEALEGFAEEDAGGLAGAAGGVLLLAAVDEAVEKGAGGDDGGGGVEVRPSRRRRPRRAVGRVFGARRSTTSACLRKRLGSASRSSRMRRGRGPCRTGRGGSRRRGRGRC